MAYRSGSNPGSVNNIQMKSIKELETKIEEKNKEIHRLKQRIKGYDTGLTPTQRKKYE